MYHESNKAKQAIAAFASANDKGVSQNTAVRSEVTSYKLHVKPEPLTFGTLHSRLFKAINGEGHKTIALQSDELERLKFWVDANVPLLENYRNYELRAKELKGAASNSVKGK